MKALSKILVPTIISMAFTVPASAEEVQKATPGRTYSQIAACLKRVADMKEGEDFQMKPGTSEKEGVVQFRKGLWDEQFYVARKDKIFGCRKAS